MALVTVLNKIDKAFPKPLKLANISKKKKESLHEFLIRFFTMLNNANATVFAGTKEIQTPAGRRRSLGDIYIICKYYYPNVTLEEVLGELYVGLPQHFPKGFRTSYCSFICKRVWYYSPNEPSAVYNKDTTDEYGRLYKTYLKDISHLIPNEPNQFWS